MNRRQFIGASLGALIASLCLPFERFACWLTGRELFLDVRRFGALGDGVADDTRAIQAALDAAEGATVFIPDGVYRLTDTLRMRRDGVALIGQSPGAKMLCVGHSPFLEAQANGLRIIGTSWFSRYPLEDE